jgi:hypothetical protein
MATMKLESSSPNGGLSGPPALVAQVQATTTNQTNVVPGLGSILSVRSEIDDVLADMKAFHRAEPDMVMSAVSAHGARLVEIIVQCQRIEVLRREWKPMREEADKVLAELKSQFQIASRLIAVRQMDVDMLRGQT